MNLNRKISPDEIFASKKNYFSQFGEDGVVEKILSIVGERSKTLLEFGAWDGVFNCNSRHLILQYGFGGCLIEGNPKKAEELKENYREYDNITVLNSFVTPENINEIINKYCNNSIDFLSIDIDGNDIYILEALNELPRILCIECNPTFSKRVSFSQNYNLDPPIGTSAAYCYDAAIRKGFFPLCFLQGNLIAVRKDLGEKYFKFQPKFEDIYNDYESPVVFSDQKGLMYISRFSGYGFGRNKLIKDQNGNLYCLVRIVDNNINPAIDAKSIGNISEAFDDDDLFLKECLKDSNKREQEYNKK